MQPHRSAPPQVCALPATGHQMNTSIPRPLRQRPSVLQCSWVGLLNLTESDLKRSIRLKSVKVKLLTTNTRPRAYKQLLRAEKSAETRTRILAAAGQML